MAIVVVGAVFMDIKGFPFGGYIPTGRNAGMVEFVHGGVGRNVAEDIGNLELKPKFVSMVDSTPQGTAIIAKLDNHKVNTEHIIQSSDGMGMWLAVFDDAGDVAGSISKRPDMSKLVEYIQINGDRIFSDCDSIVVEMDIDKEIVKQVFLYAEKYHKPVYGLVANMSIASERRDLIKQTTCFICNELEAEILFVDDYQGLRPATICDKLAEDIKHAGINSMIVTLGAEGAVYADIDGNKGVVPANNVAVTDTTGAGDAFCAGVAAALTYGKSLPEAVQVGSRLAASVIVIKDNTCPRFQPQELGIEIAGQN